MGAGGKVDLAVLDVSMPELSGLDVLRALRELRPEHRPRVVLISA
ncbi:DNA-binding response regulator, partial [Rhizobium johnstonii]